MTTFIDAVIFWLAALLVVGGGGLVLGLVLVVSVGVLLAQAGERAKRKP